MDQAQNLRYLINRNKKGKVITITSQCNSNVNYAKIIFNLSFSFVRFGYNVLIFDIGSDLSKKVSKFEIVSEYDLYDILHNKVVLTDITGKAGIKYISCEIYNFIHNDEFDTNKILETLYTLDSFFDYIIVCLGLPLDDIISNFIDDADQFIIIMTTKSESILNSYLIIKSLPKNLITQLNLIITDITNDAEYKKISDNFYKAVYNFMGIKINKLGYLWNNWEYKDMELNSTHFMLNHKCNNESKEIIDIAMNILKYHNVKNGLGLSGIFKKILLS